MVQIAIHTTMYISSYLWTCSSSPSNILYTCTHEQRESYYIQQCFVERVMGCPACMRLPQISALLYLALPHNVLSINYILSHLTQVASGPHLVIILIVLWCETLAGSGHGSYFVLHTHAASYRMQLMSFIVSLSLSLTFTLKKIKCSLSHSMGPTH